MKEEIIKKIENEENEIIGQLEYVSYHGGYPEIPKPQKLSIAISTKYLVLITNRGEIGKSIFKTWHRIETFSISKKRESNQHRSFLSIPMNLMSNGRIRNLIAIHYIDSHNNDNHILIEPDDNHQLNKIFKTLNEKVIT